MIMMTNRINPPLHTHHFCGSMLPLLQNRDILDIAPAKKIQRGDIVLFSNEDNLQWIAHRVIKIEKETIATKGDNNPSADERTLYLDNIAGVVTARWRNGKQLKIHRGYAGILQYQLYFIYFSLRSKTATTLGQLSLPLTIRNISKRLLPSPREVVFYKNEQEKKALYFGQIHIGTYSKQHKRWQIRFPWRLVYDL